MKSSILILIALTIAEAIADHQSSPGTATRPILTEDEAAKYVPNNYLSGWVSQEIIFPDEPDYVVEAGQSIQAVVNEAIKSGSSAFRTYIRIEPGSYMETVYIKGDVPLTIYGASESPGDVHIMQTISADTVVSDYIDTVNPNGGRYQEGDPAWSLYNDCASQEDTIGVACTPVFWVQSDNFELYGVYIHNGAKDAGAIAIRTSADKVHLMNSWFEGVQGTVALGLAVDETQAIQRVLIHMAYIEGEVDYVFGGAAAVFHMVTFNTTAVTKIDGPVIFAPDTSPDRSYGFLVINSNIVGDESYLETNMVRLGRSWDRGVQNATDYVAGKSPNGQLVIRDTQIGNIINADAPYAPAEISDRPFSTDIKDDRDLDDNAHNRLWEFNNSGDGA